MKTIEKSVKLSVDGVKKEVGPAKIDILESQEDLESLIDATSLADVLDLINRQRTTDECNKIRGAARPSAAGKNKRYNTAFALLATLTFEDGETGVQKLTACATLENEDERKAAMDKLLLEHPEVVAAVDAKLAESAQ